MGQKNKMKAKKKVLHQMTDSHGYAGKEETWQEQEEKAIQLSGTPAIVSGLNEE
jgi:hypothetical protein